jgi:hypothetical protein
LARHADALEPALAHGLGLGEQGIDRAHAAPDDLILLSTDREFRTAAKHVNFRLWAGTRR